MRVRRIAGTSKGSEGNRGVERCGVCRMQNLGGIALLKMKSSCAEPSMPGLAFLIGRSVWLRLRASCGLAQYCKNCLLRNFIHCLFPSHFVCGRCWETNGKNFFG